MIANDEFGTGNVFVCGEVSRVELSLNLRLPL